MASINQTTEINTPTTYAMLVIFTVDGNSHENLRDQQAMRDEARSWLEGVGATVHGVNIRPAD